MAEDTVGVKQEPGQTGGGEDRSGRFGWLNKWRGEPKPAAQQPPAESQPPPPEKPKTPEELKEEIMRGLGNLADIQLRILTAKDKLGNLHTYYGIYAEESHKKGEKALDPNAFEAQLKQEANADDRNKLSRDLIDRMEEAKHQLGDFCVVVAEGDKKGVILLSPVEKTVQQEVYIEDPNHPKGLFKDPPAENVVYNKLETRQEIFFVTPGGLEKFILPFEKVITRNPGGKWKDNRDVQSGVGINTEAFDRYKDDAQTALFAVLNGRSKTGRSENADAIANYIKRAVTGQPTLPTSDDRQNEIYIRLGYDMLQQSIPSVVVSKRGDIEGVISDSFSQADKKSRAAAKTPHKITNTLLYEGQGRF